MEMIKTDKNMDNESEYKYITRTNEARKCI